MLNSISVLLLSLHIVGQATSLSLEEDLSRPLPRRGVERSHIFSVLSTYSLHIVGQATSLSLEEVILLYSTLSGVNTLTGLVQYSKKCDVLSGDLTSRSKHLYIISESELAAPENPLLFETNQLPNPLK